jgi:hypothetical protein
MKVIATALALFFFCPALSWAEFDLGNAEDYNFELEGRYWKPKLDSTIKIVDNGIGTDLKLVDDLGFDKEKGFGEARLQVKFPNRNKLNFSYLQSLGASDGWIRLYSGWRGQHRNQPR